MSVSWHQLQAQARDVLAKAMSAPDTVDQRAVDRALDIMRLPQYADQTSTPIPHANPTK